MIESIQAQLDDWSYGRYIVKHFITDLDDMDLDRPLPRKKLNTIRKQCEELIQIQSCYVNALVTKSISFTYEPLSNSSKDNLLLEMELLDKKMGDILEKYSGSEMIDWFGEKWQIHRHISAMIGHEQMHIGQIIGFCYGCNIEIPSYIKKSMSLND